MHVDHPQAHAHRGPAMMAAAMHQRMVSRDSAKGTPLVTGTIDDSGALAISSTSIRIPSSGYGVATNLGAVTPGDIVVVAFADMDQDRRPYVIASLSRNAVETATLEADGLHFTMRDVVVATYHITSTASDAYASAHAGAAIPNGSGVLVMWGDYADQVRAYVVAVL